MASNGVRRALVGPLLWTVLLVGFAVLAFWPRDPIDTTSAHEAYAAGRYEEAIELFTVALDRLPRSDERYRPALWAAIGARARVDAAGAAVQVEFLRRREPASWSEAAFARLANELTAERCIEERLRLEVAAAKAPEERLRDYLLNQQISFRRVLVHQGY